MTHSKLTEIAIMPCLPAGYSIEDRMLERAAPSFGPQFAVPNEAFASMLRVLNISKRAYVAAVFAKYGILLTSPTAQGNERGSWRWTGEYAAEWRSLNVRSSNDRPPLLSFDELFEIMENAGYGGQFAIAAHMDLDLFNQTDWKRPIHLTGVVQIGIIDYLWGSGHTISHKGGMLIDSSHGTIGLAENFPYAFDSVCGFSHEYFRIDSAKACSIPKGVRVQRLH